MKTKLREKGGNEASHLSGRAATTRPATLTLGTPLFFSPPGARSLPRSAKEYREGQFLLSSDNLNRSENV